ncbi:hypothetical protein DRQ25_10740 [Candidatus Fermentibacteria bacterium]|nr:MAG: hypothetical protein DRQ25_10740 [Candidatus Fermentibacteria bacterium]
MGNWTSTQIIVFIAPFAIILLGVILWLFMRRSIRTRFRMDQQLNKDPDISEWLVVFGWTRKVIYLPVIVLSLVFFVLSLLLKEPSGTMGAIWLGFFLVNFMIEEYDAGIKELLLLVLGLGGMVLWLSYLHWLDDLWMFLGGISADMNGVAYLIFALIFLVAICVSWIRGLFFYVAFTPNYVNIQKGPTESGQQIGREEISTIVDTEDLLERMLGFGSILVTFRDARQEDIRLLVWGIGKKSRTLESIRGAIVIERHSTEPV